MIDHFGIIAPFYDKIFKVGDISKLIECLNLKNLEFVLDAGGGTGRISSELSKTGIKIIVADSSFQMVKRARQEKNLWSVCCVVEHMAFQNESLECILMVDALHHVENQRQTLKELWRILKPGGRIVIQEPDIRKLLIKFIALIEKMLRMRSKFLDAEEVTLLFDGINPNYYTERDDSHYYIIIKKD